ncbi:BTB/POZ and MATH domain-containing protein 2-like [Triticum dicoccoides]|uniref:BTB/POZ and MATH domain-containing protein 2-like n=1 Tax=Triticum dicoccoides TaxID=85692 RepID=UPI00188E4FDC|nr:BTB/POZ and MATH domain-containing protein 2-like [Triticum dicoccoides]
MSGEKTLSFCTTDSVQGSHVFSVSGYSKQRGMGCGKFIISGAFSVGGHDWAIRFYPDGFNKGYLDYISVYAELLSKDAQSTGLSSSLDNTEPRLFSQTNLSRFAPQTATFMARSEFEASPYLRNDHLEVECIITVMEKVRVSETRVPLSGIAAQLGKLLEANDIPADITFSVGGVVFGAHKLVLAIRSPVFKAEFYGPMKETAGTPLITIKDMQPGVFKALLHFIYTDSLQITDDLEGNDRVEMVQHLLVAADRYDMEKLKLVCQRILCENLDVENVATMLALADQHRCDILNDACVGFISCQKIMDSVAATQGYADLKRSGPSILVDAQLKIMRRLYKT